MDTMTAALKEPEESYWADPAPVVKMDLDAAESVAQAPAGASAQGFPSQAEISRPEELPISQAATPAQDEQFFAETANEAPENGSLSLPPAEAKSRTAMNEPALESDAPVPVSSLTADPELVVEPEDSEPVSRDPALVVPASVRVTPEPLLVDDEPSAGASEYGKREMPIEPAFSFEVPSTSSEIASVDAQGPEKNGSEVNERTPTGPPPNREILATIPFLSPPPEILAEAAEQNKNSDADVDAMVRKVLERLEPQLHDLLSQGVIKPLVENILQNDLAKKGR
jgi:hypothetical protein